MNRKAQKEESNAYLAVDAQWQSLPFKWVDGLNRCKKVLFNINWPNALIRLGFCLDKLSIW